MYVINFKKLYPSPEIVVNLHKLQLKETFKAACETYVITKNEIASKLVVSYIFEPDVAEMNLDLLSSSRSEEDFDVHEYKILPGTTFANRDSEEVFHEPKSQYNSVMLGLSKMKENQRVLISNPPAGTPVEESDYVIVMSNGLAKEALRKVFQTIEGKF